MAPPAIPLDRHEEIAERYICGEKMQDLAQELCVSPGTVSDMLRKRRITAACKKLSPIRDKALRKFAGEARSILWQADSGEDERHPLYHTWKDRVDEWQKKHKLPYGSAIVQATKEQRKCWKLFLKYDVEQFDKYPESHPAVTQYKEALLRQDKAKVMMRSENIEQSTKQNLAWAIAAAGEFARTNMEPESCPNDAAYFLYEQAKSSPEAFLARFTSIESKAGGKDEPGRLTTERAVDEINDLLKVLSDDAEEGVENG